MSRADLQAQDGATLAVAAYENAREFMDILSPDGTLLSANRSALESIAVPESRVCGRPFWETPWWSHSTDMQARLRRAIFDAAQGTASVFEATHQTSDGAIIPVEFSLTPVHNRVGIVTALVAEGRELSERILAETALRRVEARLDRVVRGGHDGLWDWDIPEGAEWWSSRFYELLEYEDEEIGASYEEFVALLHPDDRDDVLDAVTAHLERRVPYDVECRMRLKSGEYGWFHVRGQAEWGEDGTPTNMAGTLRKIDRRKRAEFALRERDLQLERLIGSGLRINSQRELGALLQEVTDSARRVIGCEYAAIGVLDRTGAVLDGFVVSGMADSVIERLGDLPTGKGVLGLLISGHKPIRLVNLAEHPASTGFPPGHPSMRSFLGVPVTGRDGPVGNLYFTNKDGATEFTADDEASAVMLAAEAAVAIENVRLLTELRELHASRDRFYAMVNHELRNAITGVYGWGEMFLRKAPDHRAAREVVESAEYALELMNDLLDFSRLDADRIVPEVEDFDLRDVLEEAVRTVEPSARENEIRILTEFSEQSMACRTDGKRVKQIAINLFRNAIRHSEGKDIKIEASANDSYLVFAVVDQGEGISPDQQKIIFDAYKRADFHAGGGTGLGLSLSARLAQLLGGDIDVESQLEKGARFTVRVSRSLGA